MPTLLRYSIVPTRVPYSDRSQPSIVTFQIIATNEAPTNAVCTGIQFRIPIGSEGADLVADWTGVEVSTTEPALWSIRVHERGVLVAKPNPDVTGVAPGASVAFILRNVTINSKPGVASIVVQEFPSGEQPSTNLTVTKVPPGLAITSFFADRVTLRRGESATLTWKTTGAASVTLSGFGSVKSSDSQKVSPGVTMSYTLEARGKEQQTSQAITIVVDEAKITSFIAKPKKVALHESSELSWKTIGATYASISPGDHENILIPCGSLSVTPSKPTLYTLKIGNPYDSTDSQGTSVEVAPVAIKKFTQTPPWMLRPGQPAKLSWDVYSAETVTLNRESVQSPGSRDIELTHTAEYTLRATGIRGPVEEILKVRIIPATIPITQGAGGRLYAFVTSAGNNHLLANWWNGSSWNWTDLGRPASTVAVERLMGVTKGPTGYPFVCVLGSDGALWANSMNSTGSGAWSCQGTPQNVAIVEPAGALMSADRMRPYVFVHGNDGNLWVNWANQGVYLWTSLGKPDVAAIDWAAGAVVANNDRFQVFVACAGNLWKCWYDGQQWLWTNHRKPGSDVVVAGPVGAVADSSGSYVFVLGSDGNVWSNQGNATLGWGRYSEGTPPGTTIESGVGAVMLADYIAFVKTDDGNLWKMDVNAGWSNLGTPGKTKIAPKVGAIDFQGASYVFVEDTDGHLWLNHKEVWTNQSAPVTIDSFTVDLKMNRVWPPVAPQMVLLAQWKTTNAFGCWINESPVPVNSSEPVKFSRVPNGLTLKCVGPNQSYAEQHCALPEPLHRGDTEPDAGSE